jgi:hypothetical protein
VPVAPLLLPELGTLVAICLALMAILFLYTFREQVHYLIAEPFRLLANAAGGGLPIVGGAVKSAFDAVASGIDAAADATLGAAQGWLESAIGAMVDFMVLVATLPAMTWNAALGLFDDTSDAIERLATQTIPQVASSILTSTASYTNAAEQRLTALVGAVGQQTQQVLSTYVFPYLQALQGAVDDVRAWAGNEIQGVRDELGRLGEWAGQAIDDLRGHTEQEIAGLAQHADQLFGGIQGNVDALARDLPAWAERRVQDAIQYVEGEIASGDAATAATAAAATAAVALTVEEYMRNCGNDLCANVGPIARELGDLFDILETGALLALIAYAIHNPRAAARETAELIRPLVDDAQAFVRAL